MAGGWSVMWFRLAVDWAQCDYTVQSSGSIAITVVTITEHS